MIFIFTEYRFFRENKDRRSYSWSAEFKPSKKTKADDYTLEEQSTNLPL